MLGAGIEEKIRKLVAQIRRWPSSRSAQPDRLDMRPAFLGHLRGASDGEVLYHYTSVPAALSIIRQRRIWLSEFSKTNDKTEYTYARERFVEHFQNRNVFIEEAPRFLMAARLGGHEEATMMLIGCLSTERDDLTLWDRYADRAAGCVLGIDAKWLDDYAGVGFRRVIYNDDHQRKFVNTGLAMLQSEFEDSPDNLDELSMLAAFFVLDLYCFKDPAFASEKEVRIGRLVCVDRSAELGVVDPGGETEDGRAVSPLAVSSRVGEYGDTRYVELPISSEADGDALVTVGFGPRIQSADRDAVLQVLAGEKVECWDSALPLR